eukprot:6485769-Amphidinium_carterae.1
MPKRAGNTPARLPSSTHSAVLGYKHLYFNLKIEQLWEPKIKIRHPTRHVNIITMDVDWCTATYKQLGVPFTYTGYTPPKAMIASLSSDSSLPVHSALAVSQHSVRSDS